ncbi:MAG: iron-containing alcohol dehydrogenase [Candidatus Hodarchaeales archaeon]
MNTAQYLSFHMPSKIISGKKTLEAISYELDRSGNAKKPLLIRKKDKFLKHLVHAFADSEIQITVVTVEDESLDTLETAKKIALVYREHKCDSFVACGDREIINVTKIVNILVSDKVGDLPKLSDIKNSLRPVIFVPTSCDIGNGLTDTASIRIEGKPFDFKSKHLFPKVVVVDPRTIETPSKKFLVREGLKGLFLAMEFLLSNETNLYSNGYASAAVELIYRNLVPAWKGKKESIFAMTEASCMVEGCISNSTAEDVYRKLNDLFQGAFELIYPNFLEIRMRTEQSELSRLLQLLLKPDDYVRVSDDSQGEKVISLITEIQSKLGMDREEKIFQELSMTTDSEDFKNLIENIVEKINKYN